MEIHKAATLDKLHKFLHIFNVDVIGTKTMQCMVHTHDRISCDCFSCLLYFFYCIFFCRLVCYSSLSSYSHRLCDFVLFFFIFSFSHYLTTVFYLSFMSFIVKYVCACILAINNARDPPRSK